MSKEIPLRKAFAALAAVLSLGVVADAAAKAPPDGIDVCGAAGACAKLSWEQAEAQPQIWAGGGTSSAPASPAPYFVLGWRWPGGPAGTSYYVPSAHAVRVVRDRGWVSWYRIDDAALQAAAAGVAPLPAPALPSGMARLLSSGRRTYRWPGRGWVRLSVRSLAQTPWSDPATVLRVHRAGYVWRDGVVFRIPKAVVAGVLAGR